VYNRGEGSAEECGIVLGFTWKFADCRTTSRGSEEAHVKCRSEGEGEG